MQEIDSKTLKKLLENASKNVESHDAWLVFNNFLVDLIPMLDDEHLEIASRLLEEPCSQS